MFKKIVIGAVFCVLAACGESGEQGWIHEDSGPEGLFGDFFRDGKFDGMGHPAGASVFEAVDACEAGRVVPGDDKPGVICSGTSPTLGRGGHAINVRALVEQLPGQICQEEVCPADDVFILRVQSGEEVLGEKLFTTDDFREEMRYQNLYVDFRMSQSGEVAFELEWPGMVPVEIEYIEIFLAMRRVILEPPSGVVTEGDFTIEIRDPEPDATITVACNGEDFTAVLDGLATDETSEFRRLLTAPADLLFADCAAPRWVLVEVEQGSSVERRETLYLDEAEVCGFNDGAARVLITGFVPFPPNPTDPRYQRPNSSQAAVTGFDPAVFIDDPDLPEVSVVVLQLPVEFDSAPDLLADVIARCHRLQPQGHLRRRRGRARQPRGGGGPGADRSRRPRRGLHRVALRGYPSGAQPPGRHRQGERRPRAVRLQQPLLPHHAGRRPRRRGRLHPPPAHVLNRRDRKAEAPDYRRSRRPPGAVGAIIFRSGCPGGP
jgi:hypothetical protein